MNAGGHLSLPISFNRGDEVNFNFKFAPFFGIYLIDNLELRQNFHLESNFSFSSQNKVKTPVFWGTTVSSIYYFKTPSIVSPYIGGGLGIEIMDWNLFSLNIAWEIPAGLLIGLGENIAIDASLGLRGLMSLRNLREKITFSPSFLGFRYLF